MALKLFTSKLALLEDITDIVEDIFISNSGIVFVLLIMYNSMAIPMRWVVAIIT